MDRRLEAIDLNLLLALHWLLTERSVTAAGERLGLSQPATSRALGKLRDVFEDPLLVKSGGSMVPTPLGEELRPAASRAIERCRDVLRISEPFDPGRVSGRVRIGCTDFIGVIVAKAWAEVVRPVAPRLALDIVTPTYESARDMVSGALDFCILPDLAMLDLPPTIRPYDFVQRQVMEQKYVSALRKDHPLAGKPLSLDQFVPMDHVLVAPGGKPGGVVDTAFAEIGRTRHVAYMSESSLPVLPIVMHTDSVLTAPEALVRLVEESLYIFEPPVPLPTLGLHFGWHPNWTTNARHRFVRERLMEALPWSQEG